MWNPHLGNNLHKRGYLPYMNADMERICDEKLVKAMLYAITKGKIIYSKSGRVPLPAFRYLDEVGNENIILTADGSRVTMKNVAELFVWLRNEDVLIEKWCVSFDESIEEQKSKLSNIVGDSDYGRVAGELTRSPFIKMLRGALFTDTTKKDAKGLGVLEFAYAVKVSEEASRDCDDADRLVKVTSEIFTSMCRHRAANPNDFTRVYMQQLEELYLAFAKSPTIQRENSRRAYFERVTEWANSLGAFCGISTHRMVNVDGSVNYVGFEPTNAIVDALTQDKATVLAESKDGGEELFGAEDDE
jgi:hypothetical protein